MAGGSQTPRGGSLPEEIDVDEEDIVRVILVREIFEYALQSTSVHAGRETHNSSSLFLYEKNERIHALPAWSVRWSQSRSIRYPLGIF